MTKPEWATASVGLFSLDHLDFVIHSSFVIGHSSLISIACVEHATAVCPPAKEGYDSHKWINPLLFATAIASVGQRLHLFQFPQRESSSVQLSVLLEDRK
jgi:hypothetical protein